MAAARRVRSALLALALAALAGPPFALAQSASVYTVSGVAVDQTGASAAAARDVALAAGQARAFRNLIRRLVPVGERSRITAPSSAGLAALVLGFEVESEKTSPVRYLARITVRFSPGAVRRLLRDAGVRFAETRSKPLMVLPVYRAAGATLLWEDGNSWRWIWAEFKPDAGLVPLVVPAGNEGDAALLRTQQALAGDPRRIAALARRYGAADVLLAAATLATTPGGAPLLEVTVARFGAQGADRTTVRSFQGARGLAPEKLLQTAAKQLFDEIEESWKGENLLRFDEQKEMTVHASLSGLPEWVSLRARLEGVAAVQETTLIALSLDSATLRLTYLGDARQLATALAQSDLELVQGPVDWEIRNRGTQPAAPPARPPDAEAAPVLRPPTPPDGQGMRP
ncbi:MAG: DUF2066 domain-containing protein [Alphaproteobacteria bacterium]